MKLPPQASAILRSSSPKLLVPGLLSARVIPAAGGVKCDPNTEYWCYCSETDNYACCPIGRDCSGDTTTMTCNCLNLVGQGQKQG